jgi:hypothetical protein
VSLYTKTAKISQEKPTVDKIIPIGIADIARRITEKFNAKISALTEKRDMVLAALDELID